MSFHWLLCMQLFILHLFIVILCSFWIIFPFLSDLFLQNSFLLFMMDFFQQVIDLILFLILVFCGFGCAILDFLNLFIAWDVTISRSVLSYNARSIWNLVVHFFLHFLFSVCWSTFWLKILLFEILLDQVLFLVKIISFLWMALTWFIWGWLGSLLRLHPH